jgi:hypothetical protein
MNPGNFGSGYRPEKYFGGGEGWLKGKIRGDLSNCGKF